MNTKTMKVGTKLLATLGFAASLSLPAQAADIFNEQVPVPRNCAQIEIEAIDGENNYGRGIGVACNNIVDVLAEAFPDLAAISDDFAVQSIIRSNGRIIRGIADDSIGGGPVADVVNDPGGNLTVQVVVSVF